MAIADSRKELSGLRAGLRAARKAINEARAAVGASFAAKAKADRLLEQPNRLLA
jgi:hypothetical protein